MGFQDKLGSVFIEVRAKLDRYKTDMRSAVRTTQTASARMQASMTRFAAANKAAFLGLGAAIGLATRNAVQFADQIDKVSVKTGLTRDTLQGLEFASTQLGFAFQTIETLGFRVSRRMGEAAEGSERVAEAFKQAGVELKNTDGTFRDVNEVFPELLDNMSKMESTAERNALGVKIFDTEFRTLLPLLEAGAGSIKEMTEKARDLGLILSDEVIKDTVAFGDNVDILTRQLRALFIEVAGPVLKALTSLLEVFSKLPGVLRIATVAAGTFAASMAIMGGPITLTAAAITTLVTGLSILKEKLDEFGTNDTFSRAFNEFKNKDNNELQKAVNKAADAQERLNSAMNASKFIDVDLSGLTAARNKADAELEALRQRKPVEQKVETKVTRTTESTVKVLEGAEKEASDALRSNVKETFKQAGRFLMEGDFKGALQSLAESFAQKLQDKLLDSLTEGLLDGLLGSKGTSGGGIGGGIFSSIFSGLGFANGGSPPIGKASLVGENGPELFTPSKAGTIIPNHAMAGNNGGNITMNNTFNGDAVSRQELAAWSNQLTSRIVSITGKKASSGGAFAKQFRR
jgi:hypothetical protein